jgi:beta-ketoacyl-acyl-carrier-protein synthase II
MRRVAVTGMGVVSPLGTGCAEFFAGLAQGRSAIRRLDAPFCGRLEAPIAAPAAFDGAAHFAAPRLRMLDRVSQFALHAAGQAVTDAGMAFDERLRLRSGVFIGTGMGGSETADDGYRTLYGEASDRIKPFSVLMAMNNAAASWIGIEYGIAGPNMTYSTACSSSAVAIGEAWRRIAAGELDAALAGGSEAPLTLGTLKAWEALRTLAMEDRDDPSASCKPFSRNRSGLVLGEGAAVVLLEDWEHALRRGARIHAELVGYGLCTDAAHITRPSAEGQARAMRLALESAALPASEVDYINAHGTATQANDAVETAAIRQVFGRHADALAVSSTKSMHGHLLGAAGALEFVASVMAMAEGVIPPTQHLLEPDPECDLDYVPLQARPGAKLRYAMSNSFAFGGTNAVLLAHSG